MARLLRHALALLCAAALVGCSGGGGDATPTAAPDSAASSDTTGSVATPATTAAVDTADVPRPDGKALAGPLSVSLGTEATKVTVGPDGGEVAVAGASGTRFVLTVPPGAVVDPVDITASPALFGELAFDAEGVVFGPPGLQFAIPATLAITPSAPVPVERQLLFTFSDDGTEVGPAEPKLDSKDMVIVVQHFSGYGFADLKNAAQERYVKWTTTRAEERISSEVVKVLGEERQRQLLGTESTGEAAMEVVVKKMDEYEVKVVLPRIAAAGTSCAAAKEAVATALGSERQRQLLGAGARKTRDNEPKLPPLPEILALTLTPCEKDAIERCKAAKDPSILIAYWIGANRQAEMVGSKQPYSVTSSAKAEMICDPQAYNVTGGLEDWQVNQVVCDISQPFKLSAPGVGTMSLSGGLSGTYSFGGVFASAYTGTYTISFPAGPRKPGTMVGGGGGSIAGQGGSGTEKYVLTPVGPAC